MIDINPLDIGLLVGNCYNPIEQIVMWRSLSRFSHTWIFTNRHMALIEATIGGVVTNQLGSYTGRKIAVLRYKHPFDEGLLLEWLMEKKMTAKGYDYYSWLGFATGLKQHQDPDAWFCSELAYWMFQENGYKLTNENLTFPYPGTLYDCREFNVVYEGKV